MPERFDFEKKEAGTESLNHHFRSSVNSWFYKWLAGIRLCGFGYGDVWIAPEFVNGVERLSASMHGIQVSYDSVLFEVSSPYSFNLVSDSGIVKYAPGKYAFPKEKLIKKINPVPRVF